MYALEMIGLSLLFVIANVVVAATNKSGVRGAPMVFAIGLPLASISVAGWNAYRSWENHLDSALVARVLWALLAFVVSGLVFQVATAQLMVLGGLIFGRSTTGVAPKLDPPQERVEEWLASAPPEAVAEIEWFERWTERRFPMGEARMIAERTVFLLHNGKAAERESARKAFLEAGRALANELTPPTTRP